MAQDSAKCPKTLTITKSDIENAKEEVWAWEDKPVMVPHSQSYTIPALDVCQTDITLASDVTVEEMKGAFSATEWQDDVFVMFTRLPSDVGYSAANSAMYSKETFYWSRETKEGDWAGRVPVA